MGTLFFVVLFMICLIGSVIAMVVSVVNEKPLLALTFMALMYLFTGLSVNAIDQHSRNETVKDFANGKYQLVINKTYQDSVLVKADSTYVLKSELKK